MSNSFDSAIHATKWSILASNLRYASTPIATLLLALVLTPEDFGVVAVSTLVVSIISIFQEGGLGMALIQRQTHIEEANCLTFWMTLLLGALYAVCVFLFAYQISVFFGDPRLELVLKVQSIQPVFTMLCTTPKTILRRSYSFKKLTILQFLPALLPFIVALPAAHLGYGYWALILTAVAASFMEMVLLWGYCDWRPSLPKKSPANREIVSKGLQFSGNCLCAWTIRKSDKLILGFAVTMASVGLFSFGTNFMQIVTRFLIAPFASHAMFVAYSEMQNDSAKLLIMAQKNLRLFAFICLPCLTGISVTAHQFVPVFFNESWAQLDTVLCILAISPSMTVVLTPYRQTIQALGRPNILNMIDVLTIGVMVPLLFFAAPHGLVAFLWGRFLAELVVFGSIIYFVRDVYAVSAFSLFRPISAPAIASLVMAATLVGLLWSFSLSLDPMLNLTITIFLGVLLYLGVIRLLDRSLASDFWKFCSRIVKSR